MKCGANPSSTKDTEKHGPACNCIRPLQCAKLCEQFSSKTNSLRAKSTVETAPKLQIGYRTCVISMSGPRPIRKIGNHEMPIASSLRKLVSRSEQRSQIAFNAYALPVDPTICSHDGETICCRDVSLNCWEDSSRMMWDTEKSEPARSFALPHQRDVQHATLMRWYQLLKKVNWDKRLTSRLLRTWKC